MIPKISSLKRFQKLVAILSVALASLGMSKAARADVFDLKHPQVAAVATVQGKVTPGLMATPGVLGTAIGLNEHGAPALVVYVDQASPNVNKIVAALPAEISGIHVKPELTEKFRSFAGKPSGGGVSHTAKQTPPIKLGTSGGWANDLANGYCCGGTLGSLIQVNNVQYILSNYHVFEADTVPGGNGVVATTGDSVVQPGLIDVNCRVANAQSVATLVTISSLPTSNVDCSIGEALPNMVSGEILEIGPISSQVTAAALNKAVKKSGRTTGLSRSSISGLNATVSVSYENECAGSTAFTKTFTGQIVIANKGSRFLNSGDSGSLMVEDVSTNARAIGLLFAGSSSSAIANPIQEVLDFVGAQLSGTATMVGN